MCVYMSIWLSIVFDSAREHKEEVLQREELLALNQDWLDGWIIKIITRQIRHCIAQRLKLNTLLVIFDVLEHSCTILT